MPQPVLTITIVLSDDGTVNVNGPLESKMAFYGLLEIAKETCSEFNKNAERRVQPAPPGLVIPRI